MKRFVIRNYGPTRQLSYKAQQICITNDCAIETDDAEMAYALEQHGQITVTDRGTDVGEDFDAHKAPPEAAVNPGVEDIDEISYEDMNWKEILALAKDRQIKTYGLKKPELIRALQEYDTAVVSDTPTETETTEEETAKDETATEEKKK